LRSNALHGELPEAAHCRGGLFFYLETKEAKIQDEKKPSAH